MNLVGPEAIHGQNRRHEGIKDRVVAVATERSDGACNLYMGFSQRKASLPAAQQAVEAVFGMVTWTELSDGVWVARGQNSMTPRDGEGQAPCDEMTVGGDFDDDAQFSAS